MPRLGVREIENRTTQVIRSVRPVTTDDLQRLEQAESGRALDALRSLAGEVAAA